MSDVYTIMKAHAIKCMAKMVQFGRASSLRLRLFSGWPYFLDKADFMDPKCSHLERSRPCYSVAAFGESSVATNRSKTF